MPHRRRANSVKNAALFVVLIPRNIGVLLIRGYRAVISPLYGDVCRYYPSCSAYGLGSVQQRGLIAGSVLTAWRILRCNPWTSGGIDDVKAASHSRYRITRFGWVVPTGFGQTDVAFPSFADTDHGAHHHATGFTGHEASVDSDRLVTGALSDSAAADAPRDDAELLLSSPSSSRKD
ncbi:membrane protein insertion efficiency factor YidD [Agromyces badenianii]|uniref:Putative membrane protein insertion efficiency factor n=1 Tax=Agromyces badenianii TaxID=2080742 RepID=A0A2S0WZE4_9MICO|nr:membrane protein insertion efficiency factor YidD [Agromyces badenianii]